MYPDYNYMSRINLYYSGLPLQGCSTDERIILMNLDCQIIQHKVRMSFKDQGIEILSLISSIWLYGCMDFFLYWGTTVNLYLNLGFVIWELYGHVYRQ